MSALAEALVDSGYEAVELLGRHYVRITGRVVPWDQPEIVGAYVEEWRRGAFTKSLSRRNQLPLHAYHKSSEHPLGISEAWQDEPDGLYGVFRLVLSGAAQVAADYAERGIISGLSIGFVAQESQWRYAGEFNPDRGEAYMDRVIRTRARLVEVSLVSCPAFVDAVVTNVESEAVDTNGNGTRGLLLPRQVLPSNYLPPESAHDPTPDPAPVDDAVTEAPDDIDETATLAEVIQYLRWIANRLSVVEGVSPGAVVTTSSPDGVGGGVAGPVEQVVP